MSRTDLDPTTTRALAALDPAPARPLTGDEAARAEDLLARIVAAPAVEGGPHPAPPVRRRTRRRLAVVGGLAAASAVGIVGVQLLNGGDTAYATWTATPHRPTSAEEVSASQACRDGLVDSLAPGGTPDPTGVTRRDLATAPVVLAEQRGAWTLVLLGGPHVDASCLPHDGPLLGDSTTGSLGRPMGEPGPRELRWSSSGTAVDGDRAVSVLVATVGAQVAGLVVHTAERGDVVATVASGRLAVWWPSTVRPDRPVGDELPPMTVTFTDGTSRTGTIEDFLDG